MNHKEYCISQYLQIFDTIFNSSTIKDRDKREAHAQKRAIRDTIIHALDKFKDIDGSDVRKYIYTAHVNRRTGITEPEIIENVISSDNSWKKSSGHAFEEMVVEVANSKLANHSIELFLQRDLNELIGTDCIINEERDVKWLKTQIKVSNFDLYAAISKNDQYLIYGCIQTKTSIRDRVTRDREPSIDAMKHFFWSVAVVLDGDFLKLPKFQMMVNGGEEFTNGWHGVYVFSKKYAKDRIYCVDINLETFVNHAVAAAEAWSTQRQWFDFKWKYSK